MSSFLVTHVFLPRSVGVTVPLVFLTMPRRAAKDYCFGFDEFTSVAPEAVDYLKAHCGLRALSVPLRVAPGDGLVCDASGKVWHVRFDADSVAQVDPWTLLGSRPLALECL